MSNANSSSGHTNTLFFPFLQTALLHFSVSWKLDEQSVVTVINIIVLINFLIAAIQLRV